MTAVQTCSDFKRPPAYPGARDAAARALAVRAMDEEEEEAAARHGVSYPFGRLRTSGV